MAYDGLGRMTHRVDLTDADNSGSVEADTVWTYVTSGNGLGQLQNVQQDNGNTGTNDYVKVVGYDSLGRVVSTATSLGANAVGGDYIETMTYDQFGRVFQTFDAANDPTGNTGYQGTQSRYNAHGYLELVGSVTEDSTGAPLTEYQKIETMDARGNITTELYGNGVRTARIYDPQTGRLTDIDGTSALGNSGDIQELDYVWDTVGNLTSRNELSGSKNLSETFLYDGLNRLTSYTVGGTTKTVAYDALGNITHKSDVGSYSYGQNGAGPHAATTIAGQSYQYDANGNNTSGDGRTLNYSTFDKPTQIVKGSSHTTAFEYGPDRARYKRTDDENNNGVDKTTWYIGSVEVIDKADGSKEIKRYIGNAAIVTLTLNSAEQLTAVEPHYRHYDHLGSLDVITDHSGSIVEELSFDPWGERRNGVNWGDLTATQLAGFFDTDSTIGNGIGAHGITTRGYTGHEMLDEVGIIHMNGRIYDAKIARFLQADPIIQDPLNTQSLNRYSYVWNNPLNATDPSGYVTISIPGWALRQLGGGASTLGDFFRHNGIRLGGSRFGFNSSSWTNVFSNLGRRVIPNGASLASLSASAVVSAQNENGGNCSGSNMYYCSMPGVEQSNGENEPANPGFDPSIESFVADYENEDNVFGSRYSDGEFRDRIKGKFLTYAPSSASEHDEINRTVYSEWVLVEDGSTDAEIGARLKDAGGLIQMGVELGKLARSANPIGRGLEVVGEIQESLATSVWVRTVQTERLYDEYSRSGSVVYEGNLQVPGQRLGTEVSRDRYFDSQRTGRVKWHIQSTKLQALHYPTKMGKPFKAPLPKGFESREWDL